MRDLGLDRASPCVSIITGYQPTLKKKNSKKRPPKRGRALFDDVVKLTGIPAKAMRRELKALCERKNIDVKNLTLDQLRVAAASYLREIMGNFLESENKSGTHH